MRTNKMLVLSLMVALLSCEGSDVNPMDARFSLRLWNKLKIANGNSYKYTSTSISWALITRNTELKIEDGVVTGRDYEEITFDGAGGREITDSYSETGADLGSHTQGAGLLTIDDLYSSCLGEYLTVDPSRNAIYFVMLPNGIIDVCGFVPDNCADDCFQGVMVNGFEWIN
jgi:hypothetical protein